MLKFLSLFSGIGGLDLGLERAGMECVAQVEIDPFCRKVLAKHYPDVPRFEDICEVKREQLPRDIDVIAAGFPCQPVSKAGLRRTESDVRWLWPEVLRLIRIFRPRGVLLENVTGLLDRGIGIVLSDLAASGYDAEWDCIPACSIGADIIRDRAFIFAQPESQGWQVFLPPIKTISIETHPAWGKADSLDTPVHRIKRTESWLCESAILGTLDGISSRLVQRQLGALGNAVVPQIAEWIGRRIIEAHNEGRI